MHFESIKISKQIELAIRWLIFLAQAQKQNKFLYVNLRSFCDENNVSFYSLQKINKILIEKNLIQSKKGLNGGYRLKNSPLKISLLEIISAIEGPINFVDCSSFGCNKNNCQLKNMWHHLDLNLTRKLSRIRLSQFL
jgi:Rrf2 family protein